MLALLQPLRALAVSTITVVTFLLFSVPAVAQIKSPGAHPDYSVELEPHFVLQWDQTYWADDGVGLGARASIPLMKNGPIRTINNNLAIGFGLDWVHFGGDCFGYYFRGNQVLGPGWDCDGNQFHIPVVAQWNFFFTDVVSAFGEMGLGISHATFDVPCVDGFVGPYCGRYSDTDPRFVFAVGPRFLLADSIAIVLRLGIPYFSAGVSFLL